MFINSLWKGELIMWGWLKKVFVSRVPDEPAVFGAGATYRDPMDKSQYFDDWLANRQLQRHVPPASEELSKDLSAENRDRAVIEFGEKIEGSITDPESTRNKVFEEVITSPAYPCPKFTRQVPKPGEYYWSNDGCLIEVADHDGVGETVKVIGEQWVLSTAVWYGDKGYKKDSSGSTIIPKCTEKWPDGEHLMPPIDKAAPKKRTQKKKPVVKKAKRKTRK
jgi:hypothetical protein